jgi:signal transduction histidine kinase
VKTFSLTRRLIAVVLLVQFATTVVLIAGAGVYDTISQFRAFDVMLRGRADSMLGAVQDAEDAQDNVMLDGTQTMVPGRDIYSVRDEFGKILGHSESWTDSEAAFSDPREFRTVSIGRKSYRLIRVSGLRMVDPGDKGGGIPRHVVILYGIRTNPVWERIENAILFYSALGVALLAINGYLMLRLMRRGLRPLRELAAQASKVSVDAWQFEPPEHVLEVEELNPLVMALRTALGGLERSFEQQRQFVGDAAHELKTSVAVIKSSLQVMTLRERSASEYLAGIERAEVDCERMEQLVASMLFLAGLEANTEREVSTMEVDLRDVLLEVVELLRTAAELCEVSVMVSADSTAWVAGEREQLRILCSNLLQNAIQHSAPGEEIDVSLSVSDGRALVRIEDQGEGIAPESLPHVFERFYRADRSRSRRTGGTGLGLAIAKAIVESSHGEITIESRVDEGTCVTFSLPVLIESGTRPLN